MKFELRNYGEFTITARDVIASNPKNKLSVTMADKLTNWIRQHNRTSIVQPDRDYMDATLIVQEYDGKLLESKPTYPTDKIY